ncbi:hypothetical protein [Nesterenkonia alkaliphila]|uniref:Uncharacterized protein n=1 Tax=Nesterenkonia alkaliphila TaxID=1463631 RepID=A0A7K1UEY8_9MICC|nr:hypothetical protein [Nesterenkonia alkaliphila]MVT24992.1 hypothetical protein [Nesterenkonia alkaliphila]GFZ87098.1 hypothetical protein GCM10011359_15460 [Nesterenkonia alkaliphila]
MTVPYKHTVEVSPEDQAVLERAVESNTVDSMEHAIELGYRNVVIEQLDFERRVENIIIPRLKELDEDPTKAISADEMRRRLQQRREARVKAA